METTTSKFARGYDREFKENAVALVRSGKTITDVARDLGVSHWSLTHWAQLAASGHPRQNDVGGLAPLNAIHAFPSLKTGWPRC